MIKAKWTDESKTQSELELNIIQELAIPLTYFSIKVLIDKITNKHCS
jgi:hypothetical protein